MLVTTSSQSVGRRRAVVMYAEAWYQGRRSRPLYAQSAVNGPLQSSDMHVCRRSNLFQKHTAMPTSLPPSSRLPKLSLANCFSWQNVSSNPERAHQLGCVPSRAIYCLEHSLEARPHVIVALASVKALGPVSHTSDPVRRACTALMHLSFSGTENQRQTPPFCSCSLWP